MECPDCGAVITSEDMFCGECGRPLEGVVPPSPPATPAEVEAPVAEAVDRSPVSPPAPRKKSSRLPILLVTGIGSLFACVCVVVVASVLVLRSGSDSAPVLVLDVTATPESGTLLLADDFADENSGWDVFDEDDTTAGYVAGEYQIGVYRDSYMAWANPQDLELDNFAIEVDARTVDGPLDNNFGVLVRYQDGGSDFYWFQISADGYYAVDKMAADEWAGLVDWVESDAINQGFDATNRIRVECDRDQFRFYVNGAFLTSLSEPSFSSGNVGLAVGTFDEPGAVVRFDNLAVYGLDE